MRPFAQHFFLVPGVELKRWMYPQPWTHGTLHEPQGWPKRNSPFFLRACHVVSPLCPRRCSICWLILSHTRSLPPIASLLIFSLPYFFIFACGGSSVCVDRFFLFPIFKNRLPITLLLIFCFPYLFIFAYSGSSKRVHRLFVWPSVRIQMPNALLVVFCFP